MNSRRWRTIAVILAVVGLVDSLYLLAEALNPYITLYCPSSGLVNCGLVTASIYSKFFGIPIALLGTLWFGIMLFLTILRNETLTLLSLPVWVLGMAFVGYLVFIELGVLQAICSYCTLAHVVAVLMGIPVVKLVLELI